MRQDAIPVVSLTSTRWPFSTLSKKKWLSGLELSVFTEPYYFSFFLLIGWIYQCELWVLVTLTSFPSTQDLSFKGNHMWPLSKSLLYYLLTVCLPIFPSASRALTCYLTHAIVDLLTSPSLVLMFWLSGIYWTVKVFAPTNVLLYIHCTVESIESLMHSGIRVPDWYAH